MLIDGGAPASADGWAVVGKEQMAIAENMAVLLAGLSTGMGKTAYDAHANTGLTKKK